ncbi:MAG: SAM-dependent methyltransferase [Magnetococcales bacterium]|nr:SAM-dependent methyltransferase [Magnetococcales bacterium]MBF0438701.1 SAM-dependent methyltransferase [Magnetococcales bacterium]
MSHDSIDHFLSDLKSQGITLLADGDTLRVSAPKNSMTATIRQQVAERKNEVLAFLRQKNAATKILAPVADHSVQDAPLSYAQQRLKYLDQLSHASLAATSDEHSIEMWPCPGDYRIYDEILYQAMTQDQIRNDNYWQAIQHLVQDKVVVDIGTGQDVVMGRLCIQAGAKKVYAIEVSEEASNKAKLFMAELGLAERIVVLHGDALSVQLPELADVSVSELIGVIGSSEGVVPILNDGRRFLKPDGIVIPQQCVTKVAAVRLPEPFADQPRFSPMAYYYVEKIFQHIGYPFDLRLAIKNLPAEQIVSTEAVFEELNFQIQLEPEWQREITLTVTQAGRIDGLLLWLELSTMQGAMINSLTQAVSWLPVYFPVFQPSILVNPGDRIQFTNHTFFSANRINPDYSLKGAILQADGNRTPFEYRSCLYDRSFKQSLFYEKLFASKP